MTNGLDFTTFFVLTQILYVPKRGQDSEEGGVGGGGCGNGSLSCVGTDVPPNTPNETSRTSSNSDSVPDSPLPGHAQRVTTTEQLLFPASRADQSHHHHQHQTLQQTVSSPISTMKSIDIADGQQQQQNTRGALAFAQTEKPLSVVQAIDPADRECLERFLKIAVRHITDGQGVVSGVLLVTPNALMFDPNVSDPLVIEHGTELYGVTVPMELVLKTALYTDIAHMRVKHAPEAVPSVPKPAVYYAAADEGDACIIEENLRNAYSSKDAVVTATQFDTISAAIPALELDVEKAEICTEERPTSATEKMDVSQEEAVLHPLIDLSGEEEETKPKHKPSVTGSADETEMDEEEADFDDAPESVVSNEPQPAALARDGTMDAEASLDLTENTTSFDGGSFDQNNSTSTEGGHQQQSNNAKLSSYFQTKLALSERHSAPIGDQTKRCTPPPPLVTAVSADGEANANDDPLGVGNNINKRRSAHGESRREQMLKRLSNPVDTLGTITKSGISSSINATKTGFNATKSGISSSINATKSGINATMNVTKTGLNATMSVTKTGFNKVLSTPKNLMDLSSNLVRDAKGAMGSKSDNDIAGKTASLGVSPPAGGHSYTNMVDTKVDAFENFDSKFVFRLQELILFFITELIPRPAKHSKDPPLYLCIRMGKRKKQLEKSNSKRGQRFSPTYSFGLFFTQNF